MKKLFIGLAVLSVIYISCDAVAEFTKFHFSIDQEFTIPGSPIAAPIDILTPPIATETESVFENNNTSSDLIEEIVAEELILYITSPEDGDFSFLDELEIFMAADGLDEVLIGEIHDIPDSVGDSLILQTSGADLKDYLIGSEIQLRLKTVTDKITTEEYNITSYLKFYVDAKILGL